MPYFDFSSLITQYTRPFVLETVAEGGFDDKGDHVPGEPVQFELEGAIIGHRESKLYREGGTLTAQDRRLFMLTPIETPLAGAHVLFEGNKYSIEVESMVGNAVFTGVNSYLLRWVSAFD